MSNPANIFALILARVIVSIVSILQAGRLRDELYQQREEHELMWTALDDIARMYKDTPSGIYAKNTLDRINTYYGQRTR